VIAYVGGKYRQADWISSFIPHTDTYIEVFGGAMWVYIKGKFNVKRVVYNDFNPLMANLFSCCKKYNSFIPYVEELIPQDNKIFEQCKSNVLYAMNNTLINMSDFKLGAEYAYIITQGFSGVVSENMKMIDLKGKYKSKYLSFKKRLNNPNIQKRLDKLEVHYSSYEYLIEKFDKEDVVMYVDPPYYGTENYYAFHSFTKDNHKHLADILKICKCKWILSYYDFPHLREWFPEGEYYWERKEYAKAASAKKGVKQNTGEEILIMNYSSKFTI
jgi:DNA adenine methylase